MIGAEFDSQLPLATRMRPRSLEEFVGQSHILSPGRPLFEALRAGKPHSMILWGPPGCGKTSLAQIIAEKSAGRFLTLSAVLSGVKEIREAIDKAIQLKSAFNVPLVLFVDEVHRFNKAQQDAFLPHIELGNFIFIGATTENPGFELNNALLSRARTYILRPLDDNAIVELINQAISDSERGLGHLSLTLTTDALNAIVELAQGDARRALMILEIASDFASAAQSGHLVIDGSTVQQLAGDWGGRFDKRGDHYYSQISALHKSIRGSSPDSALYWLARMLEGGCDLQYISRRLLRIASEDIGLAEPRAVQLALDCWETVRRIGSPEGELALAQCAVYLASCPKSNAVYVALEAARLAARRTQSMEVPNHLRNAVTGFDRQQSIGDGYRYAHDEPHAYAAGVNYLPEALGDMKFYHPTDRGLEARIKEKMVFLSELDRVSGSKQSRDGI